MVIPTVNVAAVHRDVIFVIDSSACLSGVLSSLLKEYIQPCIEYFCGGKLPEFTYGLQNSPTQFGLITVNPPGHTYRPVCNYYPITCSPRKLLQWIADIRLEGGLVGRSLLLSEGLAAVMELGHMMDCSRETCRSPDVTMEKHCVLVVNQQSSPHPCVESLKHAGKTAPQITKLLVERGVHLSVIAPRCLSSLKGLIESTLPTPSLESETSPLDDIDHALHPGHLVLLQGFKISAIKEKRKLTEEKMESTEQTAAPEVAMDTAIPSVKIKEESDMPTKAEIRSDSPLTLLNVKSESPSDPFPSNILTKPTNITPPTSFTASTAFTQPTLPSQPPVKIAVAGQATAQVLSASPAAGSSSHNPIQITSPMGIPDKTFFSQPHNTLAESNPITLQTAIKSESLPVFSSQSTTTTPFVTATSQAVSMTRTASGGIPSVIGANPSMGGTGPNMEGAVKAAQMAVFHAQQLSGQTANPSVPPQIPRSNPATQTQGTVPQPTAAPIGQNQQLASSMSITRPLPPGSQASTFAGSVMGTNKNPSMGGADLGQRVPTPPMASSVSISQTQPTSLPNTAPQAQSVYPGQQQHMQRPVTIWNGIMELVEMHENQRQMRQIHCSVVTNKSDVIQEIHPNTWPQKMTINAFPKSMFNAIMTGMDFNKSPSVLKTVTFQFQEPPQNVTMLRQLMVVDTAIKMFAIVHLVGANTSCPIKALILVWNDKQKQFTGLIPLEQEKFVSVLTQVVHTRKQQQQQQLLQQQQQQQQQQQSGGLQQGTLQVSHQQQQSSFQQSSAPMVQSYSQPSSSYAQPSGMQQTQMTMANNQQSSNIGMLAPQTGASMMGQRPGIMPQGQQQQQTSYAQGGMMVGQQSQTQAQGGMMTQQAGQGMQQNQGIVQSQGQGMLTQQQQGQRMLTQQQSQQQGLMGQQGQQQGMIGQQKQQGMLGQGQGMLMNQGQQQVQGMLGQSQQQGMIGGQNQQQAMMGQQQQQQPTQGMMTQQQQGQAGMMGQQQVMSTQGQQQQPSFSQLGQQEKVDKFLKLLMSTKPEQHEMLFQKLRVTDPAMKQQWLAKANHYKQQLLQQHQQNRMMMGAQQGVQPHNMAMSHGMQPGMNQGYNRQGVPQPMGGLQRSTTQMPPQQQQQQHMPSGYNQWQGQH